MNYLFRILIFAVIMGIVGWLPTVEEGRLTADTVQTEVLVDSDNGCRLEAVLFVKATTPLKKCFSQLFFQRSKPFSITVYGIDHHNEKDFKSPPIQRLFESILIHAP
ncbi:MAG TPA: hypothetical protein VK014_13945 [Cyclobacteriaceae bacterium]|nr:hypothetical protein [Cyclobacteriaceae bacterium]